MTGPTARTDHQRRQRHDLHPQARSAALVAVAGSLAVWWFAFTLGAYRTILFEQILVVWVASLAVFLSSLAVQRQVAVSWPLRLPLLIPSGWLLVAILLPAEKQADVPAFSFWLALVVTLAGLPYLVWVLIAVINPEYFTLPGRRSRVAVVAIVVAIGAACFLLGRHNDLFLTCADFEISGLQAPAGCRPGEPTSQP